MTNTRAALQAYQAISARSQLETASPHRLIGLLMERALDHLAASKGSIERGDSATKGEHIGRAIAIIDGLRASLDHEQGQEIAANLAALYDYMEERLLAAHVHNSAESINEIAYLLREIQQSWNQIPAGSQPSAVAENRT